MIGSLLILASMPLQTREPSVSFDKISSWLVVSKAPRLEDFRGKVLIVHHGPTFCCGWDMMLTKVRKELDRWGSKVAAVSIVSFPLDAEGKKEFLDAKQRVKITWPVGADGDKKFTDSFFPGEMLHYTFTLFDKKGNRQKPVDDIDKLSGLVESLVKKSG